MNRPLRHMCWASVALPAAALALACHPAVDPSGIPLYPNGQTRRLPRSEIAEVLGPIVKIDGNEVINWGRPYDLLPGCHVVELERHAMANGMVMRRPSSFGAEPIVTYALRMRPGARYVVQREACPSGRWMFTMCPSAREEQADGEVADLSPVKSPGDVAACQTWAAATLGR